MRILVCGDRNWTDKKTIKEVVSEYNPTVIIQGGCGKKDKNGKVFRGADLFAKEVADELGILCLQFDADWKKYGRGAGPIRNRRMLVEGKPNLVLAFHNHYSESKGTKDMITQTITSGVEHFLYSQEE